MKSSAIFFLPLALLSIGSEAHPSALNQTEHQSFMACNPKLYWTGDSISSRCPGPDGKPKRGNISVGQCLLTENGVLRGGHSNAHAYKKFIYDCEWHKSSLIGSVYNCKCKDNNDQLVDNSINLEGIITSRNGKLHCYNYHGKIYPKDDPDGVLREENEKDPEFEPLAGDIYAKFLERIKEVQKSNEGKKSRTGGS